MVDETHATETAVAGPELSYTRRMEDAPSGWRRRGDYAIWGGSRKLDESPYVLHEWCDRGVIPIPHRTGRPILHRIAQGTPYHVSGLFGFWIEHDVDATWLEAPAQGGSHYALLVGGSSGKPANTASLFVCPKCAAAFGREVVSIARQGFSAFLKTALRRVREFNADPALRTCPKCGAVHPPTYGFYAEKDDAVERAARLAG
jgi:predicted RNA-binding Zn-ribbon protein involved in translation (DUF1610 family)